jgi:predicted alpha-1,2-mannosidase
MLNIQVIVNLKKEIPEVRTLQFFHNCFLPDCMQSIQTRYLDLSIKLFYPMAFKFLSTFFLCSVLCTISVFSQQIEKNLIQFIQPQIGLDNGGNVLPGPCLPFGMVKLGPDCVGGSNAGYISGEKITGFSHTHVSGTGGGAKYGNVTVAPVVGRLDINDYSSHGKDEVIQAGYYQVHLAKYTVKAELTTTHGCGFHQYTFPASEEAYLIIDAGSFLDYATNRTEAQFFVGSEIEFVSETILEGYTRVRNGWGKGDAYTVYFSAEVDTQPFETGTFKSGKINQSSKFEADTGEKTGAFLKFKTAAGQSVKMKVGISFLGRLKARANRENEIPGWDFQAIVDQAQQKWNEAVGKVQVEGGSDTLKTMFYTALYHNMLMPSDRTGENPKWTSEAPYYDDFYAIWDTYRTTNPLLTLVQPKRQVDLIKSMIDIYEHDGYMPDGRSGNDNGRTQGGSNCDMLIADAYAKGLEGIDYEKAYEAMVKNAEVPPGGNEQKEGRGGLNDYNRIGYISTDYERAGSRTLEYACCDWAIAKVAKGLGKTDDYEKYKKRANNWMNLWRPVEDHGAKGFIWPRKQDGSWDQDYDMFQEIGYWREFFYESHTWEYSFYVPHDMKKLIEICGGREEFLKRLETFFEEGFYNVNNEPGFLTPCLYNYVGRPDKTASRVNKIIAENYNTSRSGLPGNDDSGAMSAWFAFHAMGFFPVAGQDIYLISSPRFEKASICLDNGKTFQVIAKNTSAKNIYVQSAKLNGKPLQQAWFRHTNIKDGGELELFMGDNPSGWGQEIVPPSMSDEF